MKTLKTAAVATLLALGLSAGNVAVAGDACTGINIKVQNNLNQEIRVTKIRYHTENRTRTAAQNNKRISSGQDDNWGPKRLARADGDRVVLMVDYYRTNLGRSSATTRAKTVHSCRDNSMYTVHIN